MHILGMQLGLTKYLVSESYDMSIHIIVTYKEVKYGNLSSLILSIVAPYYYGRIKLQ